MTTNQKTNQMLDKLAAIIDQKNEASQKLQNAQQQKETLGNSLEEPSKQAIEVQFEGRAIKNQLLETVQFFKDQQTTLKELKYTNETVDLTLKDKALTKRKTPKLK